MQEYTKIKDMENFTQKDLMMHLLQVSQHTVTREELKSDIADLKLDILKVESSLKSDIADSKQNIIKIESSLKSDISKIDAKFDRIQWLIVATILTVVLKDYVVSLLQQ